LGAEYIGQDLEDAVEKEEAEGGARHSAGPVAALEGSDGRIWIAAGPAFGFGPSASPWVGRVSGVVNF
jgi:hypothetical protein